MNEMNVSLVVSVNMDDFLKVSLERNRKMFKRYYVVTSPNDTKTISLCKDFDVDVIMYNDFWIKGAKFNKSGAIYHAQKILHEQFPDKWILLLDTDILLPFNFDYYKNENVLNELDKSLLYCMLRVDACSPKLLNKKHFIKYRAHVTDGYFQMYFDKTKYYAPFSETAAFCDLEFRDLFSYYQQLLFFVTHIGEAGAHWNGRSCKRWEN